MTQLLCILETSKKVVLEMVASVINLGCLEHLFLQSPKSMIYGVYLLGIASMIKQSRPPDEGDAVYVELV